MSTEVRRIRVSGLSIEVVRKPIKHLHLGVYPPTGRVRVAAPLAVSDDAVRLAIIRKLAWIKKQRAAFDAQPRQSQREMSIGESHYFLGRRYRLRLLDREGPPSVIVAGGAIVISAPAAAGPRARDRALQSWYRAQLRSIAAGMLERWVPRVCVSPPECRVRRMRTKWGSCIPRASRIWLNLELVKKPRSCIEFVVVHELVHLLVRRHDASFLHQMDALMPDWRLRRAELNATPLGHEEWGM
jgi:predicted metal-dependent hydrolase